MSDPQEKTYGLFRESILHTSRRFKTSRYKQDYYKTLISRINRSKNTIDGKLLVLINDKTQYLDKPIAKVSLYGKSLAKILKTTEWLND